MRKFLQKIDAMWPLGSIAVILFAAFVYIVAFLLSPYSPSQAQVPLGRVVQYSPSLTPVATAAAIGTTEQTFTVTGLTVNPTDMLYLNGPAPTSLCPAVHVRVSAANTVAIAFATLTAAACTPAPGIYNIVAVR